MTDCSIIELWAGDECDLSATSDQKRDLVISIIDRLNVEAQKSGQAGVRLSQILKNIETYSSKVFFTIGGVPCEHVATIDDYVELYHEQVAQEHEMQLAGAA